MHRKIALLPFVLMLAACAMTGMMGGGKRALDVYIVFFDAQSADLGGDAKLVVDKAAAAILRSHPAHVVIAGEKTASRGFDPRLAEPRFAAVEQALIADGVSPKVLARAPLTDAEAKVGPTGKRRVEIRLFKN